MLLMGPLLSYFTPPVVITACLFGGCVCCVLLATSADAATFSIVYLAGFAFNALAEQPAFVTLYATYFDEILGVTTTVITSAFSFAGFLVPPLLSPVMVAFGWRSLWWVLALAMALALPFCVAVIRLGPISLVEASTLTRAHKTPSFGADVKALLFTKKLEHLASSRRELFAGGKLKRLSVVDPQLVLHALQKHHAIDGHDDEDVSPDVTLLEALRMPKFWAQAAIAVTFFIYGGALNLHLPAILQEAGKLPMQAASFYSLYNLSGMFGKVSTGIFLSVPNLKRDHCLYLVFPPLVLISHLLLVDFHPLALFLDAGLVGAASVTSNNVRIVAFSIVVGFSYGFTSALIQVLVKEFFGLAELAKIQPVVYGCVISGQALGMFLPGLLKEIYGTYRPFFVFSLAMEVAMSALFVFLYLDHPIPTDNVEVAQRLAEMRRSNRFATWPTRLKKSGESVKSNRSNLL
mmetsp:Transcript_40267/g.93974  ORF Transcript_40267/g.93974 Transcript_40267/m.93974 type:complete len:462 (-) Transcript_40267:181-1566(-)